MSRDHDGNAEVISRGSMYQTQEFKLRRYHAKLRIDATTSIGDRAWGRQEGKLCDWQDGDARLRLRSQQPA